MLLVLDLGLSSLVLVISLLAIPDWLRRSPPMEARGSEKGGDPETSYSCF